MSQPPNGPGYGGPIPPNQGGQPGYQGQPGYNNGSQAWPQPQQPLAKKKGGCLKWGLIVLGVLILLAAISTALGKGGDDNDTSAPAGKSSQAPSSNQGESSSQQADHSVVYEVTSTGGDMAMITYFGDGGQQSQETDAALPWRKELPLKSGFFNMLGVTAQNKGGGEISCKITQDGKVKAENKSSGEYAVVSCNAS